MKKFAIFTISLLITLAAVVYQRITGPTYPKKYSIKIDGKNYTFKLLRSHGGETDAKIVLLLPQSVSGNIYYKRYPTNDSFTKSKLIRSQDTLIGTLPHQPPAGKLMYYVELLQNDKIIFSNQDDPTIIRFKGAVPSFVLLPHIILMFLAMFFSLYAGMLAAFNIETFRKWTFITFITLLLGGMILGPIVQKYAFGEFWTGVPFGWDLTDNKTLIAFLAWLTAIILNYKKPHRISTIIATIIQFAIYLIPHSLYGSQLNYETGKMVQGFIMFLQNIF